MLVKPITSAHSHIQKVRWRVAWSAEKPMAMNGLTIEKNRIMAIPFRGLTMPPAKGRGRSRTSPAATSTGLLALPLLVLGTCRRTSQGRSSRQQARHNGDFERINHINGSFHAEDKLHLCGQGHAQQRGHASKDAQLWTSLTCRVELDKRRVVGPV